MFFLVLTEFQSRLSISNNTSPADPPQVRFLTEIFFVTLFNTYLLSSYFVAGIGLGAGRAVMIKYAMSLFSEGEVSNG